MACTICGNPAAKYPGLHCCPRPAYIDHEGFRYAWVRHFGADVGLEDFRSDYLHGSPMTLKEYFERISEDGEA